MKSSFVYKTTSEVWDVHYTRAIENQLDVVHLPFVHKKTIGRGDRTLVHGPVVEWDEDLMTFYVNNSVDDGKTKAIPPKDISDYKDFFHLQFLMPHLWQNCISDQVRIFIAFVPVDEDHTKLYLRFYQRFLTAPLMGPAVTALSNLFNLKILHEDRRVVLTQIPKKTELRMGELLIPGDLPIIEYRKKREFLKSL